MSHSLLWRLLAPQGVRTIQDVGSAGHPRFDRMCRAVGVGDGCEVRDGAMIRVCRMHGGTIEVGPSAALQ